MACLLDYHRSLRKTLNRIIDVLYVIFAAVFFKLLLLCYQEDIIAMLVEFLVKPHATTSELLAEKEQVLY